MCEKQMLLVGTLNAKFPCSSLRSLEVRLHRKILKIRCCEIPVNLITNYMLLNLLISHNFMVIQLATLLKKIGSSCLHW